MTNISCDCFRTWTVSPFLPPWRFSFYFDSKLRLSIITQKKSHSLRTCTNMRRPPSFGITKFSPGSCYAKHNRNQNSNTTNTNTITITFLIDQFAGDRRALENAQYATGLLASQQTTQRKSWFCLFWQPNIHRNNLLPRIVPPPPPPPAFVVSLPLVA